MNMRSRLIFSKFMQGIWYQTAKRILRIRFFLSFHHDSPWKSTTNCCDLWSLHTWFGPTFRGQSICYLVSCQFVENQSFCNATPSLQSHDEICGILNLDKEILDSFCKELNSSELWIVGFPAAQPPENHKNPVYQAYSASLNKQVLCCTIPTARISTKKRSE